MPAPKLTYFCELDAPALRDLFAGQAVTDFLRETNAAVSLGILDLSEERAEVVHCLNEAGIPVTAWLLLPKDQGYWFNLDNAPQAAARYTAFKEWTAQYGLQWARIGLDIEPDMRAIQLLTENRWAGIQRLATRALDTRRFVQGTRTYNQLVGQIHADGWQVETYHIPLMVEERAAKSHLLQRMFGLVDLPHADVEVLMLYSSFLRPWGQGTLWSYAPSAQAIGIGSTGGGVDVGGASSITPLNKQELTTDLLLANRHTDRLYVFSLEGCVRQNFLPLLRDFNWQQPVLVPHAAAQRAESVRGMLRRGLWLLARPAVLLLGLLISISAVTLLNRRRK